MQTKVFPLEISALLCLFDLAVIVRWCTAINEPLQQPQKQKQQERTEKYKGRDHLFVQFCTSIIKHSQCLSALAYKMQVNKTIVAISRRNVKNHEAKSNKPFRKMWKILKTYKKSEIHNTVGDSKSSSPTSCTSHRKTCYNVGDESKMQTNYMQNLDKAPVSKVSFRCSSSADIRNALKWV